MAPTRTRAGLILLVITFVIFAFPLVNDPDFGWHLKSGQLYLQTRHIPTHDIFSYTMSGYPWVNHEYAIDSFYYLLYRAAGNTTILLSLFFLIIAGITYLIVLPRTFKERLHGDERLFVGLIALLISRTFFGVRSQVFDWLGFLLVILIWNRFERTQSRTTLLWYIPLFFLWANIHGGFLIGFALASFCLCFRIIEGLQSRQFRPWLAREKRTLFFILGVLLASVIATLFNPYGIHLYQDIFHTIGNRTMIAAIGEWQPAIVSAPLILPFTVYVFFIILLLMLMKREKPLALRDAMLLAIFLFIALSSLRFIPFFLFLSLPIVYSMFITHEFFLPMLLLLIFPSFFISSVAGKPPDIQNTTSLVANSPRPVPVARFGVKDIFVSEAPVQALSYLRTHPMRGNMFNNYGWGGTLIWALPQYNIFIDGRMPYWELDGRNIFRDYLTVETVSEGWDKKIEEYDIAWFLIKRSTPLAAVLNTMPEIWEKKYDDGFAVIFMKLKK